MLAQISAPRYLALALAARRIMTAMLEFKKGKKSEEDLCKTLASVADSIRQSKDAERYFSQPSQSPFAHYEQLTTLNEVIQESQERHFDVGKALSRLMAGTCTAQEKTNDLKQTMEFFFTLENRALHYYNQQMAAGE